MLNGLSMRTALALSVAGLALAGCKKSEEAAHNATQAETASPACDRACLIKATDQYLAALVAHDPKAAPLSDEIVFVENVTRMKPGEGLWKSATGAPTSFQIHVPDVDQQQAGWMGVLQRDGKPVMLALRLKFDGGRIVQAEHIVAEPMRGNVTNLQTVRPGLAATIPEGQRLDHGKLIEIGASYYDALDDNDGSKMPFAADCQRRENGITTAGEGAGSPPIQVSNKVPVAHDCKGQIDSGSFIYIDRIDNRRMVAADPVSGLVMGFSQLRHPFTNLPYTVKHIDGSTSQRTKENMKFAPFDMPAAHIFKVGPEGTVHEIEAVGAKVPYNAPTGWE